jgi:hypothetical protein
LKEGSGRLYYRLNMLFAPNTLSVDAYDNGFEVKRTYSAVNSEEECNITSNNDIWKIKKGTLVYVKLQLVIPNDDLITNIFRL